MHHGNVEDVKRDHRGGLYHVLRFTFHASAWQVKVATTGDS